MSTRYSVTSSQKRTPDKGVLFDTERDAMAHISRLEAGTKVLLWIKKEGHDWFKSGALVKKKGGKIAAATVADGDIEHGVTPVSDNPPPPLENWSGGQVRPRPRPDDSGNDE